MNSVLRYIVLVLAALSLFACSPARTGVVDGALTTNLTPGMSVRANAPLAMADNGRIWISQKNPDDFMNEALVAFDYAVYTEPGISPADRFAYAAIIHLEDPKSWTFVPQGAALPGSFGGIQPFGPASYGGTMHTLCVAGTGDWASDLLAANGANPPEFWLAKRWVFNLNNEGRVLAEYREPWPSILEKPGKEVPLWQEKSIAYLRDFEQRATGAFSISAAQGAFSEKPLSGRWQKAQVRPDVVRLVGDIHRQYNDGGEDNWD